MKASRRFSVNAQLERGFLSGCSQPDGRAAVVHEPSPLIYAARIGAAAGDKSRADVLM
jgi:hypothetical protein